MTDNIGKICTLKSPYPEIKTEGQNLNYARLLSVPYASNTGELGAVLTYVYNSLVTSDDENLSQTFDCVAQTEMIHEETLGKLIVMLGADPKYCTSPRGCFNASQLTYTTDAAKIIKNAIAAEQSAISEYEQIKSKIDDKYIVKILDRIIADEKLHLSIFSELQRP